MINTTASPCHRNQISCSRWQPLIKRLGACLVCRTSVPRWYPLLPYPIFVSVPSLPLLHLAPRIHSSTHPPQRLPYSHTVILHDAGKGRRGSSWLWSGNCEGMGTVPLWRVVWMTADWGSRGSPSVVAAGLIVYSPRHVRGIATSSSEGSWHSTPPLVLPVWPVLCLGI